MQPHSVGVGVWLLVGEWQAIQCAWKALLKRLEVRSESLLFHRLTFNVLH
jgi:hypothetical protein